ncbi:MAG: Sensor histidine kinase [uncultured Segetibacter sp.]|uniref:Sensor histidine kinase n=1 Tax=uncultured Segetibacter sp. TaxID=481133 RepID=A0A6J4RGS2_9BACT|nr:MAG: Sensor histidine kinase [uncultured Segetibacter sp.]
MKLHLAHIVYGILFVLITLISDAQIYIKTKSIGTDEGLSDKRVTCFFKDKTGFIWIGTKNGLNRYDGHSFKIFRPTEGNSISNEVINDITEDREGRIWVATMEGLNYYDPLTEHWESLIPNLVKSDSDIPSYLIWDIAADANGRIWIASDVYEFCNYDPATRKYTYYDWPHFTSNNIHFAGSNYNSIKKFVRKSANEFWLASNKGLVLLNIQQNTFRFIGGGYRSEVPDLRYDANAKKVFVSTEKGNLFLYDEAKNIYSKIEPEPESYPAAEIRLRGDNELWMASENGLLKISDDRRNIFLETHIANLSGALQPGGVSAVLWDNTGIRWVGSANGISTYDQTVQASTFIPLQSVSDKEGINNMGGVFFDEVSNNYFACANRPNNVFIINKNTGKIKKCITDESGRPFPACHTIKADNDKNIWLLTGINVYQYNRQTEQFILFAMPNKDADVVFRDMIQDAEGNYWFGSFDKGLYYYLSKEKKFAEPVGEGFKNIPTVSALCADAKRKGVWIGTFSTGFYYYDLQKKKLTGYFETDKTPQYASLNLVQDIALDPANNLWVATHSGGIFRYNEGRPHEKAFTKFDMKKGLSNNSFISLCSNGDSILWLLSGKGISAISTRGQFLYDVPEEQTFNFASFASDPGFPHKMFYNAKTNELLAGVGGGILSFVPYNKKQKQQFPVVLTGITVNGKAITGPDRFGSALYPIPFRFNSVSFSFAGLYYGAASDIVYEYMLEGYDENWIVADRRYSATYQNLPAENYLFHVRAKDSGGNIAGTVSGFPFKIIPPFWLTWWFFLLCASLVVLVFWLLFRSRIQSLRKKAALHQQLAELEAKALRAQMNPHFIFNSLNAIQECIVTEKTDTAFEYLSKFSRLLRLVLNNSEKNFIPLSNELEMLRLYLSLETLRFRHSFTYCIDVEETIDPEDVQVPGLLIQPYVENALWHGLRMKEGEKKVAIRFFLAAHELNIEVEDNGIGRKKAALIKSQKLGAEQFESKGTALAQQRIDILNRQSALKASVSIIDLTDDNFMPSGTRVVIRIPINTKIM